MSIPTRSGPEGEGSFQPHAGFRALARVDSGEDTADTSISVQWGAVLIAVDHYRHRASAKLTQKDVAAAALR
ncbi:hypothetical protein [Nocardia ignorata]|uniref:Uncharacterized protein n=1 Tax=Nocardia ignorata TaxID=145285 RepID=A0A4R6P0I9_NOCIG|nr:hypothetical protein [Nocardia ignorata]TDP30685.1 hypothetical protein DFR75_111150 [Nocardia ignorata]